MGPPRYHCAKQQMRLPTVLICDFFYHYCGKSVLPLYQAVLLFIKLSLNLNDMKLITGTKSLRPRNTSDIQLRWLDNLWG